MGDDTYKYFGILGVAILAVGLAFVVFKWPKSVHATFSQHVAVRRSSIIYYSVLFAVVLPLLTLFFLKWFVPTFHLSLWFSVLVVLAMIAQFACTLIPETGGWRSSYHRFLAGLSGLLLIPGLAVLFAAESVPIPSKIFITVGLITMASIALVVLLSKGKPRYFLVLQSIYFTAFFLPVLMTGYLS